MNKHNKTFINFTFSIQYFINIALVTMKYSKVVSCEINKQIFNIKAILYIFTYK